MFKPILTFSAAVLLCACATAPLDRTAAVQPVHKKVDFFAAGHTQAAFKIVGTMNDNGVEGVLVAKKLEADSYEITVLTTGAYRLLHATVTPQGIAYRYLYPAADTAWVRGRISQFLNLLLLDPGTYKRTRREKEQTTVFYKNSDASVRLFYAPEQEYPFAAQTSTWSNKARLAYAEYAPADAQGEIQVPHELVYQDGKIELALTLIRLK